MFTLSDYSARAPVRSAPSAAAVSSRLLTGNQIPDTSYSSSEDEDFFDAEDDTGTR